MSAKGSTQLVDIIKRFKDLFTHPSSKCYGKEIGGAPSLKFLSSSMCLSLFDRLDTDMDKGNFKSILRFAQENILKPWSETQDEFLVVIDGVKECLNEIDLLYALSAFAFAKADAACLEEVQKLAIKYQYLPNGGILMNNLGVMLSENRLYEKSKECFDVAASWFCHQKDSLKYAIVTLNQAVLNRALGDYKMARGLSVSAATSCHEISTEDVPTLLKLLTRVAGMLKEFGNQQMIHALWNVALSNISGANGTSDLPILLMKIQLGKVHVEEVPDLLSHLYVLLDNPASGDLNAELVKGVMIAADSYYSIGHNQVACNLLMKLKSAFLLCHGQKSSLYGSLLCQIGHFLIACGNFDEAADTLKNAKEILICYFGQGHHIVALCANLLGLCFLLNGNTKEALKHLNEALAKFRELNPYHLEMGGILLKLALVSIQEGNFENAQDSIHDALDLLISACGKQSPRTAIGYFQSAMLLLKDKVLWSFVEEKLLKAVNIFEELGLETNHSDVLMCRSLLGVLQILLGRGEEAEKNFEEIQQQLVFNDKSCLKCKFIPAPLFSLLLPSVTLGLDTSFYQCAKILSLVNLVHMKTGCEKLDYLHALVSCLQENKMDELEIWDFGGQDIYYISRKLPISDKPVVFILSSDPKAMHLDSSDTKDSHLFLSSVNSTYFILFLRISHIFQGAVKFLDSALYQAVVTMCLQPTFQADVFMRTDFYREVTVSAHDIFSLCKEIDCLPLHVQLELSELQEQHDNFDLNSWQSSVKFIKPSLQMSYLSCECCNQREAELLFDHLILNNFHEKLCLSVNGFMCVTSNVWPVQNVACFVFGNPRKSLMSLFVESITVIVKCCSTESDVTCFFSVVQNALQNTLQSLSDIITVKFVQSLWLPCKDLGANGGVEESPGKNRTLDGTSHRLCSGFTLETKSSMPSACSRDGESDVRVKPTVGVLQNKVVEARPLLSHPCDKLDADVDVCLCLLECLLRQTRPASPSEEEPMVSSSFGSYYSDFQVNQNHSVSSSLNSLPGSPSIFQESDDLATPKEPFSGSLSPDKSQTGGISNFCPDQGDSETSSYRHLSNHEEASGGASPSTNTKNTEDPKDLHELQSSSTRFINVNEKNLSSSVGHKNGAQQIHASDTEACVANDSKLLTSSQNEHLHVNQSQKQGPSAEPLESIPRASSAAVSEKCGSEALTNNFESETTTFWNVFFELQQELRHLKDQLKKSEEDNQRLQVELGKYLFLEEKEKRRRKLLDWATSVQEPGSEIHSGQGLSAREDRLSSHVRNSSERTSARDCSLSPQPNRHERKQRNIANGALLPTHIAVDSVHSQGVEENDKSLTTEDFEIEQNEDSSRASIESSTETSSDTAVSSANEKSRSSSMKSALSIEEFPQFSTLTSDGYLSDSSESSLLSSSFEQTAMVADSSCNLQCSSDTVDGSPILTSLTSEALRIEEIPLDPNTVCSEEKIEGRSPKFSNADVEFDGSPIFASLQSCSTFENSGWNTASPERELLDKTTERSEREEIEEGKELIDSCDRVIKTVPCGSSGHAGTDSSDNFASGVVTTQSIANRGNFVLTQKGALSAGERQLRTSPSDAKDWERLGARPKLAQRLHVEPEPTEPVVYITDGLAGDFLARHTQDKALHDSICQTDVVPFFKEIPLQGTSYIDSNMSQSNRFQATSETLPYDGIGSPIVSRSNGLLGGFSYAEPFGDNSGPWPSHLGNGSFSFYSDYLSKNTSTAADNFSLQSDFVHSSHRFAGVDHFDGQTYFPSAQQTPYPPMASDPVLNSYPGMTGSSFADPSWSGAALTPPGDPVHNAPRFSSFSSQQLTDPAQDASGFAGNDDASAFISNQGTDGPAQKTNLALGNSRTTTGNIDDDANSAAQYKLDNSTTFNSVLAARSTHDTSVLEPRHGDADNNRVSMLNNTDFGTDSIEASDNSLLALERRVAEACALVERVFREREEREQFGKEIERKEQLIREQRARERREREERELREAENWPQEQEAITARSQWLCEHYQRHCRVRFPCCTQFYPCHRCHNISKACDNEEAKACHATHLKCSHCQHEQEIGEDSAKCRKCGGKMSAYFCAICKHFTSVDKNPYHCEKCGICRIHQDKSFHCEVCNVCLDKRLKGNHKCRPDSGHDECCICLEDAFSGCQILPCSHKVHRECAIAMIQNGIRTCPICRHPLYSQSRE